MSKSYKRKKEYQAACREYAKQGKINNSSGVFVVPTGETVSGHSARSMISDYFAGYKLGGR